MTRPSVLVPSGPPGRAGWSGRALRDRRSRMRLRRAGAGGRRRAGTRQHRPSPSPPPDGRSCSSRPTGLRSEQVTLPFRPGFPPPDPDQRVPPCLVHRTEGRLLRTWAPDTRPVTRSPPACGPGRAPPSCAGTRPDVPSPALRRSRDAPESGSDSQDPCLSYVRLGGRGVRPRSVYLGFMSETLRRIVTPTGYWSRQGAASVFVHKDTETGVSVVLAPPLGRRDWGDRSVLPGPTDGGPVWVGVVLVTKGSTLTARSSSP